MRRLEGKVIVVAGAGALGNGLALRYADEGAAVVLGDIDLAAAEAAGAQIAEAGGTAVVTRLDGADEASVKAAVDLAVSKFGGLDGFHANFASFADGATGEDAVTQTMEIYDEIMRVNARGFLLCTRHAVPAMLKRGGGSMIYTTSIAAFLGEPLRLAYAMSKVAVHALMRHVAKAYGSRGIRANAIAPGMILEARVMDPEITKAMASIPLGRLGKPPEVAALGALLMSDEGSFITGQVLSVDGGASMRQ